jgi:hypothetical protein
MIFPKQMAQELDALLKKISKDNSRLHYDLANNLLLKAKDELKEVEKDDIEIFHAIVHAYNNGFLTKEQKKEIIKKLEELHNKVKQSKKKTVEFRQRYSDINILINLIEQFLEHEENYLDYEPGAGKREYIKLLDLVQSKEKKLITNKAVLEIRGNKIFYDEKIIQGVDLQEYNVEIIGEHYSDKESISKIYYHKEINSENERYSYIAEPGRLSGKNESYIKRYMGAKHADSNITVKILVPVNMCWIRVERDVPAKFAIESKNVEIAPPKQKGFKLELKGKLQWAA